MPKTEENQKEQMRTAELEKLRKLFEAVDEPKRRLVECLIQEVAFLAAENA